jgi:hypothetical protein
VWLAESPDVAGANLWLFLITCVSTLGGCWGLWLANRRKGETAAAVDEALETQDRLIVQPIARERDDYRARWIGCEEAKRHD